MKKIFLGALAMLALASCSQDEFTSVNHDGDEIAFSVVANKGTRAADVYCNNNPFNSFKVWASLTNGSTTSAYINGDEITKDNNSWVNSDGTRYWPNEGALNFYANVGGGDLTVANGAAEISNYTVKDNVSEQEDILYAAALNKTKTVDGSSQVMMNFRHAMSQIVFQAKNINPNLYVEVKEVRVCHLANNGSFSFSQSTADNFEDHSGTKDNSYSTGTWSSLTGDANYGVTLANAAVLVGDKNADATKLTYTTAGDQEDYTQSMLLMPQEKDKWTATTATSGFYFAVKCAIYNVAGDSFNANSDVALWGSIAEPESVVIPADISWQPGKKYIYTFVFGEGNGGYKPDPDEPDPDPDEPDPDPDEPEPVLVPITFNVNIDDFDVVTSDNLPAEAGK